MNGQSVAALFDGDYALAIERTPSASTPSACGPSDRAALVRGHCSLAVAQLFTGDVTATLVNARPGDRAVPGR